MEAGINVRELIAVNHFFTALNMQTLKREALMFDRISIPQLSLMMSLIQNLTGELPLQAAEYEWLCEQGLLFETNHEKSADIQNEEYQYVNASAKSYANEVEKLVKEHDLEEFAEIQKEELIESIEKLKNFVSGKISNLTQLFTSEAFQKSLALAYDYYARGISIELRELKGLDAYPILMLNMPFLKQSQASNPTDIIDVTFNALPVPDENTSWEHILDFRRDQESKSKFLALKNWTNEVARMQLEPREVADKLESLINDYRQHMEAHRIKTRLDTLKTIVVAEAGFITSGWLAGLGGLPGIVGMVVTPLYSIKQRRVALLQEELKAPGREVAYIVKAREEFER